MLKHDLYYIIAIAILPRKNHRKIQTKVITFIYVCLTKGRATNNFHR